MTRLPFRIDPESVVAEVKNGVLTVTIPKPAELKAEPRKVEIKEAA
jgi:HSP20 family protein